MAFINSAKPLISPPAYSASATAASFPERSINPYNKSRAVILSPVFNPSLEPPVPAAFLEISIVSLRLHFSIIIVAVMILVVEAIFFLEFSFLPNNTLLVFLSITTQARELTSGSFIGSVDVSVNEFISVLTSIVSVSISSANET